MEEQITYSETFDKSSPHMQLELNLLVKRKDVAQALFEISTNLRNRVEPRLEKFDEFSHTDEILNIVFDEISRIILADYNIIMDDIII